MKLCNYGCGQEAKYPLKNGKWKCSKHHQSCPVIRKKFSDRKLGIPKSKESSDKSSQTQKWNLEKIKNKYPLVCKIDDFIENEKGEILAHCKNEKCKNSKQNGGRFIPKKSALYSRIYAIEGTNHATVGESCHLYCSIKCKETCSIYGKTAVQLINQIKRESGEIDEPLYTAQEYKIYRDEVLKRAKYKCEYCEEKAEHVHHSRPQKLESFFVLDPDFGIACCEKCHYKYGHKDECSTGNLANKVCI